MALVALVAAATLWLALTDSLQLYIHPRYIVFTVTMTVIAALLMVGSLVAARRRKAHQHDHGVEHDHEHGHGDEIEVPASRRGRLISIAGVVLAGGLAVTMLVLPPATLSSATAEQRDLTASSFGAETQDAEAVADSSADTFASFTVVDWSSLLRQTGDPSFYAGKPVDVVGFVSEHPDGAAMFTVARFTVTCCAVDAQPSGIPVYLEGWSDEFEVDSWVRVTGEFTTNPSRDSEQPVVLVPDAVEQVEQPSDPYLF